ncbi:CD82 antigen-like [Ahaetulla prasina]|uniref:CD82 antigen-like n=1 Tax=Ahaetulla prasina TaxID=499056 RepID=UPI0026492C4F|nr:CD82 antigen-like [Ahaetulla prasina]
MVQTHPETQPSYCVWSPCFFPSTLKVLSSEERFREKATMPNCCCKCLKGLFCFFNGLLFVVGATMFSLGLWVLITKSVYVSAMQSVFDKFQIMLYIFIVVGALAMFLGLWGSLGLFFGVRFVLIAYIPLLIVVVIFHFFPGLFFYFENQKTEDNLAKNVLSLIQSYNPMDQANQHKEITWDYVQVQLSCCGWSGPENWKNNSFFQEKVGTYPCSCSNHPASFQPALGVCRLNTVSHKSVVNDWPVQKQGCSTPVRKWFKAVADIMFLVSFIVIAFEILGISLSFYICAGRNVYAVGHR